MMHNHDTMSADIIIRMNPAKPVLHYDVGDTIRLSEQDFLVISAAFFAEIESEYTS